jgi:hypothetical protein
MVVRMYDCRLPCFPQFRLAFLVKIRKGPQDTQVALTNWINGLWLSSLIFSEMSAFLASLAEGWVVQNIGSSTNGEIWSAAGPC